MFKKLNLGSFIWGIYGGAVPQTMSKYLTLKYLLILKETNALKLVVQTTNFWAPILRGLWGSGLKKVWETTLGLKLNNFTLNCNSMFCGLVQ